MHSPPTLPLMVRVHELFTGHVGDAAAAALAPHLLLVYTGRTRLAKDLLQRVLRCASRVRPTNLLRITRRRRVRRRQWSIRDAAMHTAVWQLRLNAAEMAARLAGVCRHAPYTRTMSTRTGSLNFLPCGCTACFIRVFVSYCARAAQQLAARRRTLQRATCPASARACLCTGNKRSSWHRERSLRALLRCLLRSRRTCMARRCAAPAAAGSSFS